MAVADSAAVIDLDAGTVRRSLVIAASTGAVWAAVTEPAHISRWFGEVVLHGDGVGATGTIGWPDRAGIPLRVESIEPPHRVSYRWSNDDASPTVPDRLDEKRSTVFTFTLEPTADGTRLTVVESGFESTTDPAANLESHRRGWDAELDELAVLIGGRGR